MRLDDHRADPCSPKGYWAIYRELQLVQADLQPGVVQLSTALYQGVA